MLFEAFFSFFILQRIPQKFVRKYGETFSNSVFVKLACGSKWKMELTEQDNKIWFENGWLDFAKHYALKRGSMLIFRYEGNSEFHAFIGKISLETFIGQFHMWLAGDTKGLLVILSPPTWVFGLGWWINLIISSCLFIFVCYYMSQTTHEISVWICKSAQPSSDSTKPNRAQGEYQAVPLLPTTNGSEPIDPNQVGNAVDRSEDQDEEIWDSSLVNEKKPNRIKQLLDDTRVKSLLFLLLVSFVNHFC